MWRGLFAAGLCVALAGCAGPAALGRSALRHEQRAEVLEQIGDGDAAARERQRAQALHETARLKTERRVNWFWSDVMLQ
jgi:hypothetical protein